MDQQAINQAVMTSDGSIKTLMAIGATADQLRATASWLAEQPGYEGERTDSHERTTALRALADQCWTAAGKLDATIADGVYFVWPAGGAWVAARYTGGMVETSEVTEVITHTKAHDSWAGIEPDDDDPEVPAAVAARIIRDVFGDEPIDPEMVVVTRMTFHREAK